MENKLNIAFRIATAAAVAIVVYSCGGNLKEETARDISKMPVQTADSLVSIQTQNGQIQVRMETPRMERYENDSVSLQLFPEGFAVYSYIEGGLLETSIIADNARHEKYSDGRESWSAFGNVVVTNLINKEVMETDTLYWDRQNERIYTDCYVRLYSPDGFMQGYGMESDQRARNSVIFNPFNSYGIIVQDSTKVNIDSVNFIGPFKKRK